MGSDTHIVPLADFNVAWHERAIQHAGDHPVEAGGTLWPTPEGHAADRAAIARIREGITALSADLRASSRWPSRHELWAALDAVAIETGYILTIVRPRGSATSWHATLDLREGRDIVDTITVNGTVERGQDRYYCRAKGGPDSILSKLARAVSRIAGPQITYLSEDYSPAPYTALYVP